MKANKLFALTLAFVLALGVVGLSGCSSDSTSDGGDTTGGELTGSINVEGSDTIVNMGQAWAEEFMNENPGVMVSVKGGGSGTGIAGLINGTVDFANASRAIKDEEVTEAEAVGVDPVEHQVAIDGIAVVVNPANGVAELSMDDLGKIYRGEVTNWKDIGGVDADIVLLGRDTSSGTYEYFKEAVVGEDAEYAPSMRNLASNQALVDEVKGNEQAIAYVGLGYLTPDISVVAVDGVKASIETAADGSYPISRYLYMYSNGTPEGVQAAYLEWILGEAGQAIVVDQGFVPLP